MTTMAAALPLAARARNSATAYVDLTKPRVVAMVLVTSLAGFYLGARDSFDLPLAIFLMVGTALAAGGTLALNQYMERDLDARMERTRARPLPQGRIEPSGALIFGLALTAAGCGILWRFVNPLSAMVTVAIAAIYLLGYTPLKRVSSLCSIVGAIPGAMPPMAGWAAARGNLGLEAWVLFAIMFLWQLPHSLAIGQLYRADYARAGIRLLPTDDPDGFSTSRQIVSNSFALIPVAMLPTLLGFAGITYFIVAMLLGLLMLASAIRLLAAPRATAAARRVVFASLVYLPSLLLVMVLDKV